MPRRRTSPRTFEVPADQQHLPRAERQFPFRALPGEEAERDRELTKFIAGIEDMILGIVVDEMTKKERRRDDWKDEIIQTVRVHLVTRAMPQFDAWRKPRTKPITFAHRCITNTVRDTIKRLRRQHRNAPVQLEPGFEGPGPDRLHDDRVREVARQIIEDPERFGLTKAQGKVLRAIATRPHGTMVCEVARDLGYVHAGSLSTLLGRIREHIQNLDILDFDTNPPWRSEQRHDVSLIDRGKHARGRGRGVARAA